MGGEIEVTFFIRMIEIDRGRNDAIAYSQSARCHSTAPAPPSKWPVIDLVELMETLLARSPKTVLIARVSATSPRPVEVACALM